MGRWRRMVGRGRRMLVVVVGGVMLAAACSSSRKSSTSTTTSTVVAVGTGPTSTVLSTPVKPTCALNVVTDAVTGAFGSASEIGWAGNAQGVVTCLGGTFYVQ